MKSKKKMSVAMMTAILVAGGYGGYTIIKEKELESLRTFAVPVFEVARVIDGDTFELADGDRVRLIAIDAPEKGECFYKESKDALKKLIEGKEVELRKDVTAMDDYGRLLRYVILPDASTIKDNILVSEYMVKNGYAVSKSSSLNKLYYELLTSRREQAMKANKGLWGVCDYELIKHNQVDSPAPSEKCSIKGNISTYDLVKTYFIKGCTNYNQVKIDPNRGEKYFCSEEEALEAGYEKGYRCP